MLYEVITISSSPVGSDGRSQIQSPRIHPDIQELLDSMCSAVSIEQDAQQLRDQLNYHNYRYYVLDDPEP